MRHTSIDIDDITTLLRETADELVLPRFRALGAHEILRKETAGDPDDIVTVVDRDVEERLAARLRQEDPGAVVVGEEAVYARPELLDELSRRTSIWLIDPIDGTKNFARGSTGFGIMLARLVDGEAQAAWIVLPARGEVFVAERGSGAFRNGSRITRPEVATPGRPRGTVHTRYLPAALATRVVAAARDRYAPLPDSGASAVTYTEILLGLRDFDVYYRLLPWDHVPGVLLLREGGGEAAHVDGQPYTTRSSNQLTVVAGAPAIARDVGQWLAAVAPTGRARA